MQKFYITILDFSNGKVYTMSIQKWLYKSQTERVEKFLIECGFSLSNIEWMTHLDEVNDVWTIDNKIFKTIS